jgi:DNA-binding FadR family transcriptional regulator
MPQHEAIVEAIITGDPAAAELAMRRHIDSVIEALRALPAAHAPVTRPTGGGSDAR